MWILCSFSFYLLTTLLYRSLGKKSNNFQFVKLESTSAYPFGLAFLQEFFCHSDSDFTQIMSIQVQYCLSQWLIYSSFCSQCEILNESSSSLQPCLYHTPRIVSAALWAHLSHNNGTSAAPSCDFVRTHTRTQTHKRAVSTRVPLLHGGFMTTKLCMHPENKSAWTLWQERAHPKTHTIHKKNNIEIWMKARIPFSSYFAHVNR